MGTLLQQACETLDLKSVCRLIEEGEDLNTYAKHTGKSLPPIEIAVKAMHVELTVLLMKHGARCIRVSTDRIDQMHVQGLLFLQRLQSPFTHLKQSDQLDLYMDKLFQFFHNVKRLLSTNHLPTELQLSCCFNETCSKGCVLDRDSIINSFVFQIMKLHRCDIIKLILQRHGEVFSVAMLNGYLELATMNYRCKDCFREFHSHGADINHLRKQPDIFNYFLRIYHNQTKHHDHAILTTLFDSDFVVRMKTHFHDICFLPMNPETRRLLVQQMCVRCERCEQEEKNRKLHEKDSMRSVPSEVYIYSWRKREWNLIGMYYYAGYYPELSYFGPSILACPSTDGLNMLCYWINYTTGFIVPNEWIRNCFRDSVKNNCESIASIIKSMTRNPRKLQNCCVISIRKALCSNVLYRCKQLPLPEKMKKLITLNFH